MVHDPSQPGSPWTLEKDEQAPIPEYQVKAHLVLEGSEHFEWGMVKDCHGAINFIPLDAEVVGTWNKYGDGTFWVSLQTPIQALQDRATILIGEIAESRRKAIEAGLYTPKTRVTRPRKPKPELEPEPSTQFFADLRAGLGASSGQES